MRGRPPVKLGEEAVVEAADPGLAGADDARALAAGPGHDVQLGLDVDDPEPVDEVARQPARKHDLEAAGDEVDQQPDLAVELGAAAAGAPRRERTWA